MSNIQNYPIKVKELDNKFYLICETMNIIVEHEDLIQGYLEIKQLREKINARYQRANITPPAYASLSSMSIFDYMSPYIKILIVTFIVLFPVFWIARPIIVGTQRVLSAIEFQINHLSNAARDPGQMASYMNKFANTLESVTPEKKLELRRNLHKIVKEVKPFADELRPLINNTPNIAASDRKQSTGHTSSKNNP